MNKKITLLMLALSITLLGRAQKSIIVTNLDNNWSFRQTGTTLWREAKVPGTVHMDLLRNKEIPDPYYRMNEHYLQWIDKDDWEYKTSFKLTDEEYSYKKLFLRFYGLDTFADVYLNDNKILSANNMFRTWNVDVKDYLNNGNNELKIVFTSAIKNGLSALKKYGYSLPASNDQAVNGGMNSDECVSPFVRKAPYHFGWDWGPRFVTSGIYRPIVLIAQNDTRIDNVFYHQDNVSKGSAKITTHFTIDALSDEKGKLIVKDKDNGKIYLQKDVQLKSGTNKILLPFTINNPRLWWTNGLGKQELYNLTASFEVNGKDITSFDDTIGLRSLKLIQKHDKDGGTTCYFELNGVPVFMKGANHIPNDMFVDRMTKDVYDNEIDGAKRANMNMLRVWGGGIYEDDYFYKKCDEDGILIWQDFMFACSMYPDNQDFYENVKQEAIDNVKRLRNHPCIALWCGNNEIDVAWCQYDENSGWGWKQKMTTEQRDQCWKAYTTLFKTILPEVVKDYDGRDYHHSSPIVSEPKHHSNNESLNDGDIHYWGVWHGKEPFENYQKILGRFMSEYGFQSFPDMNSIKKYALPSDYDIESEVMRSHQRSPIGNSTILNYMKLYYKVPNDFKDFIYLQQVLQAEGISTAIETHRCNMPHTMGSLFWQINDCWPVASWSSTDYYRNWKALQYFAKKSFSPLLLSAEKKGDDLVVFFVNDKLQEIKDVDINYSVMTIDGKIALTNSIKKNIGANKSTIVLKKKLSDLFWNKDQFIVLQARKGGKLLAEKIYYPTKIKDMSLIRPNIKIDVKSTETPNKYLISIYSDKLAKNLYLDIKDKGVFSDNYMDILPEGKVEVYYETQDGISLNKIKKNLKYNCIQYLNY